MNSSFPYFGEIIAILTALSWSIGIFPFTEAAKRMGASPVNHFRLLLAVILLTLISVFVYSIPIQHLFTAPLLEHWIWFGLSGIIGLSIGDYFGFRSLMILGTRIGSVFGTLSPGISLLAGYLILHEKINCIGAIGMLVTIVGIMWVTLSKEEKSKIPDHGHGKVERGILFGVLAATCQGVGMVLAKKGMDYTSEEGTLSSVHVTWMRMLCGTLVIYLTTVFRGKIRSVVQPVMQNQGNANIYSIGGTIFSLVIGASLSMHAISLINISVAQTIFALVPILALPLALVFYKEKITLKAITGALIAIGGVVVLIWRDAINSSFFN